MNDDENKPAEHDNEHNTQAKNEGTAINDGLDASNPNVPENLQTTSAHRNTDATANTIGQVKDAHDAALQKLRDDIAGLKHDLAEGLSTVHERVTGLGDAVVAVPAATDPQAGSVSLDLLQRLIEIERAVGIRRGGDAE